jgi:sugar lactone lactonase YvrE
MSFSVGKAVDIMPVTEDAEMRGRAVLKAIAVTLLAGVWTLSAIGAKDEPMLPPSGPAKDAKIVAGPVAESRGDRVSIHFALDKPSDVAVRILDSKGRTLRNLASGVLGENAPSPFKKGVLAQEIEWDKKDDTGSVVPAGKYIIKVDVGLRATFDRFLASSLTTFGEVVGMDVDGEGRLYVKTKGGGDFLIFDREGRFVRSILPYNPNVLPQTGVGRDPYEYNGGVARLGVSSWMTVLRDRAVILPAPYGLRMIDRFGFFAARGPQGIGERWPRKPYAVDDEKNVYQVNNDRVSIVKYSLLKSAQYKVLWVNDFEYSGKKKLPAKRHTLGVPGEPGDDEKHFRAIAFVKVGPDGKIYVADRKAVKVFEKNGLYLGSIPAAGCRRLVVGAKTSSVYLLLPGKVVKIGPWPEAKQIWSLPVPAKGKALAVDESKEPHFLWVGSLNGASSFSRIPLRGNRPGIPVHFGGRGRQTFLNPGLLEADNSGHLYVLDGGKLVRLNASDGSEVKVLSKVGSGKSRHRSLRALAVDAKNGYLYFTLNDASYSRRPYPESASGSKEDPAWPDGCYRFTLEGEPAPFAALGTNYIRANARGVAVGKDGTFYLALNEPRYFRELPGTYFFFLGEYYKIGPDGVAAKVRYEGKPVTRWDSVHYKGARGNNKVTAFPDGTSAKIVIWNKGKPGDSGVFLAHVDAYDSDGRPLKRSLAVPVSCSGDIAVDRYGSLYVTDTDYFTTTNGAMRAIKAKQCSYVVKFEPEGGVRGVRGVAWEKRIGRGVRTDSYCACRKGYLGMDELDRLYHPDPGNHCVEILDRAASSMLLLEMTSFGFPMTAIAVC